MAANQRDIDAMELRQAAEQTRLIDEISEAILAIRAAGVPSDAAAIADDLLRWSGVGRALKELYRAGSRHIAEKIRLRLEFPADEDVTIIAWPVDGCPESTPHAHLRFGVDDAHAPKVPPSDLLN